MSESVDEAEQRPPRRSAAERIAEEFHDSYESAAARLGWETQRRSRVPFDDLPAANRATMIETVRDLLDRGIISV